MKQTRSPLEERLDRTRSKRKLLIAILWVITGIILIAAVLFFGGVYSWLGNSTDAKWTQAAQPGWSLRVSDRTLIIGDKWNLVIGSALAVLWFFSFVPVLRGLDDWIQKIGELHRGPNRYKRVLRLSVWLTMWLWGVGLFVGTAGVALVSVLKRDVDPNHAWFFPWDKIIDPGILIGTCLGTGTIFALILAFAEVREHLTPRAMSFKEALSRSTEFITRWHNDGCELSLCAYYPFIGAVNQGSYPEEFESFCAALKDYKVKCTCLALREEIPSESKEITALAKTIEGGRPTTIEEAIAAFSDMWFDEDALAKFSTAIADIKPEFHYLRDKHNLVRVARFVPDFHFLLAIKQHIGTPAAAFILMPLRPAGMPSTTNGERPAPPMVGMEVHDADILRGLLDLYNSLPLTAATNAIKSQ
jgi:hypothetical protein